MGGRTSDTFTRSSPGACAWARREEGHALEQRSWAHLDGLSSELLHMPSNEIQEDHHAQ